MVAERDGAHRIINKLVEMFVLYRYGQNTDAMWQDISRTIVAHASRRVELFRQEKAEMEAKKDATIDRLQKEKDEL